MSVLDWYEVCDDRDCCAGGPHLHVKNHAFTDSHSPEDETCAICGAPAEDHDQ